jgi:predicted Zn finger-like uncharacterized protein
MLTTCPECRTAFRISHAQLETRRGMVRCGYCRAVFNAYDTLLPEFGPSAAAEPDDSTLPEAAAAPVGSGEGWVALAVAEPALPAPPVPGATPGREADAGDLPLAGWENEPEPELPPAPDWEVEDRVELSAAAAAAPAAAAGPGTPPLPHAPAAERAAVHADSPEAILLSELPGRDRIEPERLVFRTTLLALASLLLFALLAAQGAYFLRGPLVAALPETRPFLEAACRRLGCEVPLARQADALRVESSSLETDPEQSNHAKLRLSLSNRSNAPQAWPHLLLKLTDPRGDALAQRAFRPADYLAGERRAQHGLAPLDEVEILLDLDLGGLSAAGYEVRPHYP